MNKITVYYIECRTGCTCCSYENHYYGFFKDKEPAVNLMGEWQKGKGNPLASQYAKYGIYELLSSEAEVLPDGRVIIEDRVFSDTLFEHPERIDF